MNKDSALYKFSIGYLFGLTIGGGIYALLIFPPYMQACAGVALGIVGLTWLQNRSESNK